MEPVEQLLSRWSAAGLLDDGTVSAIRAYEKANVRQGSRQWLVLAAITFGGILLIAGILLFAASKWETLSHIARLLLALGILVLFHGFGILVQKRFATLATAMHGLGTITAGAAIALISETFLGDISPTTLLLWALCAAAGWFLLRDQVQQILTLLLFPAWIMAEWHTRTRPYMGGEMYLARLGLLFGVIYLCAFVHERKQPVLNVLFSVGAVLVPCSVFVLAQDWLSSGPPVLGYEYEKLLCPFPNRLVLLGTLLLASFLALRMNRKSSLMSAMAVALGYALPWARTETVHESSPGWQTVEPSVLAHLLVATCAVLLVWWGVHMFSTAIVTYGLICFGISVLWFYYSSVMNRLDRSFGLIALGALFLIGGWAIEKTRRTLAGSLAKSIA